jgi:hypothetical protein
MAKSSIARWNFSRVKLQGPQRAAHGGHGVTLFFEESCPGFKAADIIVDAENAISVTHAAPASINPTDVEHPPRAFGSIPQGRYCVFSRCARILDLALKRRDFTADSEMPKVFAVCATEACSR